jgi:hypothetical protein
LKVTSNVALQAQALGLSLPKYLVQTVQVLSLQVLPLACFVMTQASTVAANLNTRVSFAHLNQWNRRWGNTPAAVLRLENGI